MNEGGLMNSNSHIEELNCDSKRCGETHSEIMMRNEIMDQGPASVRPSESSWQSPFLV
jgi:hypothetical protein